MCCCSGEEKVQNMASKHLALCISTMERVYGTFKPDWKPKNFAENKSRYLWTDAFGVVNFLTLFSETKDPKFLEQAKILIQEVHDTLGKTRGANPVRLPGATEERPLLGGLRIGKPKEEGSGMSEDGQYYHYLTKWMLALNTMTRVTGDKLYNEWGIDLAKAIHPNFVRKVGGGRKMSWKLSIDLQRPLVNSEGGLDPYDGYAMYRLLQETAENSEVLADEIFDMKELVESRYKGLHTN